MNSNIEKRVERELKDHTEKDILGNSYQLKNRFSHIWHYPSRLRLFKRMDELSSSLTNKTILDYGCGRGEESIKYIKSGATKVFGIDISPVYVKEAAINANRHGFSEDKYSFLTMDAHKLSFPDNTFDLVIGQGILHHLDPDVALNEIFRVLKSDGMVVLQEPLADNPLLKSFRLLTPDARTVDEAPFTKEQIKSFESNNNWKSHTIYCGVLEAPVAMITSILTPKKPQNWLLVYRQNRVLHACQRHLKFLESVCTINFRKEMKIVINDYAGHPFQVQLSRELACNGHSVLHTYFASDITPRGNLQKGANDSTNLHIKGLSLGYKFKKYSFIQRRKSEIKFGELVVIEIQKFEPEVIICSNTPLDPLKNISKYCKSNNIKVIIWLQDIISVGISHILRKKYGYFALPVGLYYKTIEKKILHDAKHIIGISSGFSDFLDSIQIDQSKISYISNWSPINEIPICEKVNSWSECNSLSDKTVLLYAGTLGMKHNPQLLIDLAESFKDDATVIIVIITEGLGASYIEQKIQTKKLTNILLLPFQPFSDLPEVLGSADVLLAILEKEAGKYSVPSKILTYFCSNRPVLLSVPNDNLIYQIVEENSPGVAIDAYSQTSTEDFISSARELVNRPNLRNQLGKNGRQYAEDNFSIKKIASKFLQIINPK